MTYIIHRIHLNQLIDQVIAPSITQKTKTQPCSAQLDKCPRSWSPGSFPCAGLLVMSRGCAENLEAWEGETQTHAKLRSMKQTRSGRGTF